MLRSDLHHLGQLRRPENQKLRKQHSISTHPSPRHNDFHVPCCGRSSRARTIHQFVWRILSEHPWLGLPRHHGNMRSLAWQARIGNVDHVERHSFGNFRYDWLSGWNLFVTARYLRKHDCQRRRYACCNDERHVDPLDLNLKQTPKIFISKHINSSETKILTEVNKATQAYLQAYAEWPTCRVCHLIHLHFIIQLLIAVTLLIWFSHDQPIKLKHACDPKIGDTQRNVYGNRKCLIDPTATLSAVHL